MGEESQTIIFLQVSLLTNRWGTESREGLLKNRQQFGSTQIAAYTIENFINHIPAVKISARISFANLPDSPYPSFYNLKKLMHSLYEGTYNHKEDWKSDEVN